MLTTKLTKYQLYTRIFIQRFLCLKGTFRNTTHTAINYIDRLICYTNSENCMMSETSHIVYRSNWFIYRRLIRYSKLLNYLRGTKWGKELSVIRLIRRLTMTLMLHNNSENIYMHKHYIKFTNFTRAIYLGVYIGD